MPMRVKMHGLCNPVVCHRNRLWCHDSLVAYPGRMGPMETTLFCTPELERALAQRQMALLQVSPSATLPTHNCAQLAL